MGRYTTAYERLVWDPAGAAIVLLEHGDWMLDEIQQPQSRFIQQHHHFRARTLKIWDRGGVGTELTFSRLVEHATTSAARDYVYDHKIELAAMVHKPLQSEVLNGSTYRYQAAAIQGSVPKVGIELPGANWTAFTYTIPCSDLGKVTV